VANGPEGASAARPPRTRELDVIATRKQQAGPRWPRPRPNASWPRLNLEYTEAARADRRHVGNRRARVGAYATAATSCCRWCRRAGCGSTPISRKASWPTSAPGQRADDPRRRAARPVFHGRLGSLAPATGAQFSVLPPENATGNFTKIVQRVPVRIVLDEADGTLGQLRPGLSVHASMIDARDGGTP
jgi:membrane fusion protein (multidrug efflux system)